MRDAWRYVGYDESNHGLFPEICVTVSGSEEDAVVMRDFVSKRRNHRQVRKRVGDRDYSYLLFTETEKEIIPVYEKLGVVLGSLVYGEKFDGALDVYIDGEWGDECLDYALDTLGEVTRLRSDMISIRTGANLDKRVGLVNIADEVAHWFLTRKLSFEDLRKNPHRKEVLLDLI